MIDRDEHVINQLHVIALFMVRAQKHSAIGNHNMSRKYLERAREITADLMVFIAPDGRR